MPTFLMPRNKGCWNNVKKIKEMFRMSGGTFYYILANFFSILVFFQKHSRFTGQQIKGKGTLYHFHPFQIHFAYQVKVSRHVIGYLYR